MGMRDHAGPVNTVAGSSQAYVNDAIDEAIGRLTLARERVESAVHRVTRLADRMVGAAPTTMASEKTPPTPIHNNIEAITSQLLNELDLLFDQLDRLNR